MKKDSINALGENLQEQRQKAALTQAQLAEKADLSVNHYAKIERGEVVPGLDTLPVLFC